MGLAIQAFAQSHRNGRIPPEQLHQLRLVIAGMSSCLKDVKLNSGGYDDELDENVETLRYLQDLCDDHLLAHHTISSSSSSAPPADTSVVFLLNFSNAQRSYLLSSPNTLCLLYTPLNEHFGIVPIEAGACGLPVLATNTGGPLETIVDDKTGLLRRPNIEEWARALEELVPMSPSRREDMAKTARKRVQDTFSLETLGREMEESCREALSKGDLHTNLGDSMIWGSLGIMVVSGAALAITLLAQ